MSCAASAFSATIGAVMRAVLATVGVIAIVVTSFTSSMVAAPSQARAASCYEIYGEVRRLGGSGWAHIVVVQNDCEEWLQCTVWTNVDPQPPAMMTVGPGMSEKAQITRDSEEKEFKAYGTCRYK